MRRLAFSIVVCGAHFAFSAQASDNLPEWIEYGGGLELAYERQQNLDLESAAADDVDLLPAELQLELHLRPSEYFEAHVEAELTRQFVLREEGENESRRTELQVTEAYLRLSNPDWGLSLQVGRQPFEDERQWIYDADLDALRGIYAREGFFLELSASRNALVDQDLLNETDQESVDNYILYTAYDFSETTRFGAYGILSDHRNAMRDRPLFLGIFASGSAGDRLDYWADAAVVRGREEGNDLRGFGFDLLATYHFAAPLSPHVILGYAFGSGDDDPDDGRDNAFRQTGLQGNETEVGGRTPVRYYGEAFDPELSNMSIFTAGVGLVPYENFALDLLYHHYRQVRPSDELRDSALDAEPNGVSRKLGNELDLVLGFTPLDSLELRGLLGLFLPGTAFGPGADPALFARFEARYEF